MTALPDLAGRVRNLTERVQVIVEKAKERDEELPRSDCDASEKKKGKKTHTYSDICIYARIAVSIDADLLSGRVRKALCTLPMNRPDIRNTPASDDLGMIFKRSIQASDSTQSTL